MKLQIGIRKWRCIGHTLRKWDEAFVKQAFIWNPRVTRRRGTPQQTRNMTFLREEAEKYATTWGGI